MTSRSGLKCTKKTKGKCGVVQDAEACDDVGWCLSIENDSVHPITVNVLDDPACMPEIDPATFAFVAETHGDVTGAASGAGVLDQDVTLAPCAKVTYHITAKVRDKPLCPSWIINTSKLEFEAADCKVYCKDITSEPIAVGVSTSGREPEPCNPLSLDHNAHAWKFFGGDSPAEHAFLAQVLAEGLTLATLIKALPADVLHAAKPRCAPGPYDNLQFPPEVALTATAVSEAGPPFEGGPGEQP